MGRRANAEVVRVDGGWLLAVRGMGDCVAGWVAGGERLLAVANTSRMSC